MPNETIQTIIERALDTYAALGELGEEIEDEWSYVTDLVEVWRTRLTEVATARGTAPAPPQVIAAVDRATSGSAWMPA